jgi:hypothetical protein
MPRRPDPPASPGRPHGQSGQASVELIAVLPLAAAVLALAWQAVLAGHAAWAATAAARAAARAAALAGDPATVARARLGAALARGARVDDDGAGRVTVSVLVPAVLPGVRFGRIEAGSSFRPQDGS